MESLTPKNTLEIDWPPDEYNEDITHLRRVVEHGLPLDIENAYDEAKTLRAIVCDDTTEQQAAKAHIWQAVELFEQSYRMWVAYELGELRRIIAQCAGNIRLGGQPVVDAEVVWLSTGRARIHFITALPENSKILVY